jgi:hypothetical protein
LPLGTSAALAVVAIVVSGARVPRLDSTEVFKPSPKRASMPICNFTIRESTLSGDTKTALAREMARIHSSVNHVPSTM